MEVLKEKGQKVTHPLLDAARLTEGALGSGDTVGDTAVALAKAPELSAHFLGKKAIASWSEERCGDWFHGSQFMGTIFMGSGLWGLY